MTESPVSQNCGLKATERQKNNKRSIYARALSVIFWSLISLSFVSSNSIGDNGVKYLQNVVNKFSGIRDYTVDVRVHLDLENVKAPDMEAEIFYKAPDKVKIKSAGIFVLPREIGVFNPCKFDPDKFIIQLLDSLTCHGDPCVRISLIRRGDKLSQNVILTIDTRRWLIEEISSRFPRGIEMKATITYGTFNSFSLPAKVEVNLVEEGQNSQQNDNVHGRRFGIGTTGKVTIYYSNYKINTGLSDSLFVKGGTDEGNLR